MHYNVKRHICRRFVGSCRASLASNAKPWRYTKSEAIKISLQLKRMIFSERELYALARPSVCCLFVTFVHPTQAIEIFGNISMPFGTLAICNPSVKILRRSSQGNPSVGGLNQRGVEKCNDFGPGWQPLDWQPRALHYWCQWVIGIHWRQADSFRLRHSFWRRGASRTDPWHFDTASNLASHVPVLVQTAFISLLF